MDALPLTHIPSLRTGKASHLAEQQGFVDEAEIARILAAPTHSRLTGQAQDLALAIDDSDFAGWQHAPQPLTPTLRPNQSSLSRPPFQIATRRAAPPEIEANSTPPRTHHPRHGVWIAALAGMLLSATIAIGVLQHLKKTPDLTRKPTQSPQNPTFHAGTTHDH
ncbi:MAG: hypothetical protein RLZZ245_712 [Verrucomicrobiota bacterium]